MPKVPDSLMARPGLPDPPSPRDPCGSRIGRRILAGIGDRNLSFVFPSQAAADSWARAFARNPRVRAVESDRFLGWDTFIDGFRVYPPSPMRKIERQARLLWAANVSVEEGIQAASPREINDVAVLAPRLRSIARKIVENAAAAPGALAEGGSPAAPSSPAEGGVAAGSGLFPAGEAPFSFASLGREQTARYLRLAGRYEAFLRDNDYFEATHLSLATLDSPRRFVIFGSCGIPDFALDPEFGERVEVFEDHVDGEDQGRLRRYPTFRDEIDDILSICADAIDSGLPPERIALSVQALSPDLRAHLARGAAVRGIELSFHSGEPLSDSPFGRLLAYLRDASAEGFSARTLRRLAQPGAFPWKKPDLARSLARLAASRALPEASADPRRMEQLWRSLFGRHPRGELGSFFEDLRRSAGALGSARDFSALREAIFGLRTSMLDETASPAPAQRTLERILEELGALERAQGDSGAGLGGFRPFDLFLLDLQSTRYGTPATRASSIRVYPFAVSSTLAADLHFVLDASQDSTETFSGIPKDIPRELYPLFGEEKGRNSFPFAPFSSAGAMLAHARKGLSGFSVLHPSLAALPSVEVQASEIRRSPEFLEQTLWSEAHAEAKPGIEAEPLRLPKMLIDSARRYFACSPGQTAAGPEQPDPAILKSIRSCSSGDYIKISPSRLAEFLSCPFKWFTSGVPEIVPETGDPVAMAEGSLIHSMIRDLLEGANSAASIEESFERCLISMLGRTSPAIEPDLRAARLKILDRMRRLLDAEREFEAAGWDTGQFEIPLARRYPEWGLSFEGRADRIARSGSPGDSGPVAIVDYKKRSLPRVADFTLSEKGTLTDFQIAGYTKMLESTGAKVGLALYWSVEDGTRRVVFGPGGARTDREAFEPEMKALEVGLETAAKAIAAGAYLRITPSRSACSGCQTRRLCRAHFASERA